MRSRGENGKNQRKRGRGRKIAPNHVFLQKKSVFFKENFSQTLDRLLVMCYNVAKKVSQYTFKTANLKKRTN